MPGTGESRPRPARRQQIVGAAREIAAARGWPAVTVRAIAARIGCSAPAIYQYFRGKDAVLAAVAAEGEAMLDAALERAADSVDGPAKKLRAAMRGLWNFAEANAELYAIMYGGSGQLPHAAGGTPPALRRIAAKLAAKRGAVEPADDFADRIAACVHGFIAISQTDRHAGGSARALELCSRLVDDAIRGLDRR